MARCGSGSSVGVAAPVTWFDVGWAVFVGNERDSDSFPPLNDMEAQREWLGGFGSAWASDLNNSESLDDALARALEGRGELLRQLRSHASERSSWSVH